VLGDSPWASTIAIGGDNSENRVGTFGPVANVVSALVVRQAIVRQHQIGSGYGPQQSQQDAACLTARFDDRIIFRFSGSVVFRTPPDLIVSGSRIHPLQGPAAGATTCISDLGNDISYPKYADGKSIFKSGHEKLAIKTDLNAQPSPASKDGRNDSQFIPVNSSFEFNTKSMVYKGKPDF
jgi:hypothetical protein